MKSAFRRAPRWGWRLVISVILVAALAIAEKAYDPVQGAVQGELAVKQLSDDPAQRALGRAAAQLDPSGMAWTLAGLTLLAIWTPYGYYLLRAARRGTSEV
jgi:hypothetical protein